MNRTKTTHTAIHHSPGPWMYDMNFIVAPDPGGLHPDIYIAEIAHADDEGRIASPQQQDANRRLIAAAPELLEALRYLLDQTVEMDISHSIGLTEGEEEARAKALAAIAKATCDDPMDFDFCIQSLLTRQRQIAAIWSIDDVCQVRPDLTGDQAWQVLQRVSKQQTAEHGITWETLESAANDLFPESTNA